MTLKDKTFDLHKTAEETVFSKKLVSGELSKECYAKYLYNLMAIYDPLEWSATRQGMFKNLEGIQRLTSLYQDFKEIDAGEHYLLVPSVIEYHDYLIKLGNDPLRMHQIKAHVYCRHMGDLYGGQIIKKSVKHITSGNFYEFKDANNLKKNIRDELTEDLAPEARTAFVYAIRMLGELDCE